MTESSLQAVTYPDHEPELRTIAMPADTNGAGDIFGGWLLGQMDIAAGMHAAQEGLARMTTVGIEAMSFHSPVYVGDRISCYCTTTKVGRTSLTVHVETWVRRRSGDTEFEDRKVTEGMFTFVALNTDGSKRIISEQAPARQPRHRQELSKP